MGFGFLPADFAYQNLLDILHSGQHDELLQAFPKVVKGKKGAEIAEQFKFSAQRAKDTFGWRPIDAQQTVVDMTKSLAERQKEW